MLKLLKRTKLIYNILILLFARPNLQRFYGGLFRLLIGFMGYMNWAADFKMTGEKKLIQYLDKYNLDYALDIGANTGQWAKMALTNSNISVISIEPQAKIYDELKSIQKKYQDRFHSFNLAVGNKSSKIKLHTHDTSSELSYIDDRLGLMPLLTGKSSTVEEVNMQTLDQLHRNHTKLFSKIDFIKIDVEGYEMEVLLGAQNFLEFVRPKFIQIEINWHLLFTKSSLYQIGQLLRDYSCYKILPSGKILHKIDHSHPMNNIFQLSNVLFIRNDFIFKN